jgi:hypothetical protein
MLALRRPAPLDLLARRIAGIDWRGPPPTEGSRWWLVETCRAELAWAAAQWRRFDPAADEAGDGGASLRLPHEHEAARLVNTHLHVDVATSRIRELLARLPGQRAAAADTSQDGSYRACWRERAAGCESELRDCLERRRRAWRVFLQAASHYRHQRAALATTQDTASAAA